MAGTKISINFEIEPIVKLRCLNGKCKNRITGEYHCNLKHIDIDDDGRCKNLELWEVQDD